MLLNGFAAFAMSRMIPLTVMAAGCSAIDASTGCTIVAQASPVSHEEIFSAATVSN